jgi:hypothetical protein
MELFAESSPGASVTWPETLSTPNVQTQTHEVLFSSFLVDRVNDHAKYYFIL